MEATEEPDSWMTPIKEYLMTGALPAEAKKRRKIPRKAPMYLVQDGRLYQARGVWPSILIYWSNFTLS